MVYTNKPTTTRALKDEVGRSIYEIWAMKISLKDCVSASKARRPSERYLVPFVLSTLRYNKASRFFFKFLRFIEI